MKNHFILSHWLILISQGKTKQFMTPTCLVILVLFYFFTSIGLPFTFGAKGEDVLTLMTTGILSFSVAWAVDDLGNALVPPVSTTNINNLFK